MILAPSTDEGRKPFAIRVQEAPGKPWKLMRKTGNRPLAFKTAGERDEAINQLRNP